MSKITVIGAGSVGAAIANDLTIQGIASEIVLVDINTQKARGEALDIYQGAHFGTPTIVRPGDYSDADGSDVVIITSGLPRKPGQTRLELAQSNVNIIKQIAPQVVPHAPNAIYIIVSNPVDVLTYVFHKVSGLPENQIIGSGTILDTSRLQAQLAKQFHVSPKNVHAHVYGEHGDSSFVPWSLAHISNNHIDYYATHSPDADRIQWTGDEAARTEIEEYVRTSGAQVIKRKGMTNFAIAAIVAELCGTIMRDRGSILTVTSCLDNYYGISDVCISVPCIIGKEGILDHLPYDFNEEEMAKLKKSAESIRSFMDSLNV